MEYPRRRREEAGEAGMWKRYVRGKESSDVTGEMRRTEERLGAGGGWKTERRERRNRKRNR